MGSRNGTYTRAQADSGTIRLIDVPGTSGIINVLVVTMAVGNLPESDSYITLTVYPGGISDFGTDENGNIGAGTTYTPDTSDETRHTWNAVGVGVPMNFPDGINLQEFRTSINFDEYELEIEWAFQTLEYDMATDFPESLDDAVENEGVENIQFDEETEIGSAIITFDYTGDDEPTGFVTEYQDGPDWFPDGDTPYVPGQTHYTIPTYTFETPSSFPIRITPYKLTPDPDDYAKGPVSSTIPVSWDEDTPDINFEGGQTGGFIDLGGTATMVFAADPSGIYTLVPGKTNDTLYDRDVTPVATVDVKIPDPFLKTGFLE